jgi:hypothetical protein
VRFLRAPSAAIFNYQRPHCSHPQKPGTLLQATFLQRDGSGPIAFTRQERAAATSFRFAQEHGLLLHSVPVSLLSLLLLFRSVLLSVAAVRLDGLYRVVKRP